MIVDKHILSDTCRVECVSFISLFFQNSLVNLSAALSWVDLESVLRSGDLGSIFRNGYVIGVTKLHEAAKEGKIGLFFDK